MGLLLKQALFSQETLIISPCFWEESPTSSTPTAPSAADPSSHSPCREGWVSQAAAEGLKPVLGGFPHSTLVQAFS